MTGPLNFNFMSMTIVPACVNIYLLNIIFYTGVACVPVKNEAKFEAIISRG